MLNRLAREKLEASFPLCWVAGEISNLTFAASGHVYFSLKDAAAQVRCVMFRNRAQLLGWRLENGQHIEARVLVTLYEARGDFQLNVEAARKAGIGNLYEQFLRLKEKLEREGLFDGSTKRELPAFPLRIGIVTSAQAAALRDVVTTLARRSPHVETVIYPTPVQGEGAAEQIARAIRNANERQECDVLILCRGGGGIEDLWSFNEEVVARAIRASTIPIVSGVGHETDFTIADFAADQRAPTPTAAAEMAAPQRSTLLAGLAANRQALLRTIENTLAQKAQQVDGLSHRLQHPAQRIEQQRQQLLNLGRQLDHSLTQDCQRGRNALAGLNRRLLLARPEIGLLARRLEAFNARLPGAYQQAMAGKAGDLTRLAASLAHLNPNAVLDRGYSIVTNRAGVILHNADSLEPNDPIAVCFGSGRANAAVTSVTRDAKNPANH
ncbi:MAG: exodeoxyribonuclease VII large subunit [Propionivibrio sp.]